MASNLVLTAKEGNGASLTLFPDTTTALANNGVVVLRTSLFCPSPWEIVKYPGFNGVDAKFMGARARRHTVKGLVTGINLAALLTAQKLVSDLNTKKERFTTTGPIASSSSGMVVADIEFDDLGEGTGLEQGFTFMMFDLVVI